MRLSWGSAILTTAGLGRIDQEALKLQSACASQRCAAAEFVNRLWMVLVDELAGTLIGAG